jgi:hypothetical protein
MRCIGSCVAEHVHVGGRSTRWTLRGHTPGLAGKAIAASIGPRPGLHACKPEYALEDACQSLPCDKAGRDGDGQHLLIHHRSTGVTHSHRDRGHTQGGRAGAGRQGEGMGAMVMEPEGTSLWSHNPCACEHGCKRPTKTPNALPLHVQHSWLEIAYSTQGTEGRRAAWPTGCRGPALGPATSPRSWAGAWECGTATDIGRIRARCN